MKNCDEDEVRVGIFGSTFDPPHYAHLIAAEWSREALSLDFVLMIPANRNPLKQPRQSAPADIRLQMIGAAVKNTSKFIVSEIEVRRAGASYMVETLKELQGEYPPERHSFYLLLGADVARDFHLWRNPLEVSEMASLAVFNRSVYDLDEAAAKLPGKPVKIWIPQLELSSTIIRRRVREGKSIEFMVPPAVTEIIEREGLYRS